MSATPPLPTLLVIPTGVGCVVGGYAGDGLPAARRINAAPEAVLEAILAVFEQPEHQLAAMGDAEFVPQGAAMGPNCLVGHA